MKYNWLKYTKIYYLISAIFIISGVYAVVSWGLPLGLDFTGGAVIDYRLSETSKIENVEQKDALESKFSEAGVEIGQIQLSGDDRVIVKTRSISPEEQQIVASIAAEIGVEQLSLQNVGPTVGPELVKKTMTAIIIASVAILLWVAMQFKKITFGVAAILAMLHDSLGLVGMFALLGHFWGAEMDFLFVTALLTTLSFSVHDTIVVFDRIREIQKKHGGEITDVGNRAVTETMRRSVINSLTIIIMLLALVLLGGGSIRWFAMALLIGAISGTYSSPFVAVPLYVVLTNLQKKLKKK